MTVVPSLIALPDLAPVSVNAPAAGAAGQSVLVACVVTNRGSANASGTWLDGIYFSSSMVFDANATLLTEVVNSNTIPVGGSYAWTSSPTLPQVPAGTYYLFVVVDDQSRIYESTKTNNTSMAVPIMTLQCPPPVVLTIQPTNQTVMAGGTATFTVVVAGTGPFTYQWLFNGTNLSDGGIITTAAGGGENNPGDGDTATNAV